MELYKNICQHGDFKHDENKVKRIKLEIEVLRTEEERGVCAYGPGQREYGHSCKDCENDETICFLVKVKIDEVVYDYVTNDVKTAEALKIFLDNNIEIEE